MSSSKILRRGIALPVHVFGDMAVSHDAGVVTLSSEEADGFVAYVEHMEFSTPDKVQAAANHHQQGLAQQAAHYEALLTAAAAEATAREEAAYQAGVQAGRSDGAELAGATLTALEQGVDLVENYLHTLHVEVEHAVISLAQAISQRILGDLLRDEPERLAGLAQLACQKLKRGGLVRLRFAPEDARLIQELANERDGFHELKSVVIDEDTSLPRGSCIAETEHGSIDAGISAQLEEIVGYIQESRSGAGEADSAGQ